MTELAKCEDSKDRLVEVAEVSTLRFTRTVRDRTRTNQHAFRFLILTA